MTDQNSNASHGRGGAGRRRLNALLDRRNEHPERLSEIDSEIEATFGRILAIFVLDMSGFSRLTQRYGTVHFLAMIRRMVGTVGPLIGKSGGMLVKCEADNVFALFPDVTSAFAAARATQAALREANRHLPADWDVHVAIGIGWGPMLVIDDEDMYGHEVNLASKLGEDVGRPGEILLTAAALGELDPRPSGSHHTSSIGGEDVPYFRIAD